MFEHVMSNVLYVIIFFCQRHARKQKKYYRQRVINTGNNNNNNIRNLAQILTNDNKTIEKELQAKLITR